jgi:hypothetical protein
MAPWRGKSQSCPSNGVQRNYFLEANIRLTSPDNYIYYRTLRFVTIFTEKHQSAPILNQTNPVHILAPYIFKMCFNIILRIPLPPMPPHVLMNFRGVPPGCGDSVADFWGWDAHVARLRCPDDVSGDMQEDEIPGGAFSLHLLTTQTMVTTGIFPCKEKFPW